MTYSDPATHERIIRDALRAVSPEQAQAIRDAYYKAVEGLHALADALEIADLAVGDGNDHPLIEEHILACQAIETLDRSLLGRIV